ncbi:MAG: PDZ domain-containing protein [Kofleriaceae bacterium]
MTLRYSVRLASPESHVAEVTLRFAADTAEVDVTLPAWCPGSYMIRDYARFVRDLRVDGGTAKKVDKQTWRIHTGGQKDITVHYAVYGHDLTVRTNHIDADHAFLHGPATFMYPVAQRHSPVEVQIHCHDSWVLTTAAQHTGRLVHASSIDELYDQPIHCGVTRTYTVPAKLPVELAIWGERIPGGSFDEQRLATDLAAIVDDHVARFGEAPFHAYTFMLMLAHDAYGGLEHRASSVNLYNTQFAQTRKSYEGLLELLSHELFHAWNGKRIAPRVLLDFDYAQEAYTPCLWLMEGVTSHYDRFALRTSGRISAKSLLDKILDDWARLQATPGRARQSLEASSFDAWIKLYKPDESNLNTTVSYYLKGGLVLFTLDLQIRRRTEGAKSLDDVLRLLWTKFGKPREAHPEDLQPVFEEATGLALGEVFDRQIRGVEDPDLAKELAYVGIELKASHDPAQVNDGLTAQWLGVTTQGTRVTAVFDGSPAHAAGISPGDELIAIDRFRASSDGELRTLIGARGVGTKVTVSLFRRHQADRRGGPARGRATHALRARRRRRTGAGGCEIPGLARRVPSRGCVIRDDHDDGTVGVMLLYSSAMTRFALLCLVLAGCSSSKKSEHGLAPADDWGQAQGVDPQANNPHAANPHAGAAGMEQMPGVATSNEDLPDVVDENGNNPHAGLKRNSAGGSGGGPMGMDQSTMNSLAPDPNRKIDPSHKNLRNDQRVRQARGKGEGRLGVVRDREASGCHGRAGRDAARRRQVAVGWQAVAVRGDGGAGDGERHADDGRGRGDGSSRSGWRCDFEAAWRSRRYGEGQGTVDDRERLARYAPAVVRAEITQA